MFRRNSAKALTVMVAAGMVTSSLPMAYFPNQTEAAVIDKDTVWKNVASVPVTVATGTDALSGVDHVEYQLTGATTQAMGIYNSVFYIKNEGATTVEAYTVDKAGNVSPLSTAVVRIDRTAPSLPDIIPDRTGSANHDVLIHISSGSDPASGLNRTEYSLAGATTQEYTTYHSDFSISANGTTVVKARSIDNAGNISAERVLEVTVDKLVPSKPAITFNNHDWSNSGSEFQVVDGVDTGGSGVWKSQYKIGESGEWTDYSQPVIADLEQVPVYARTIDKAGNISEETSAQPSIDRTPPDRPEILLSHNGWYSGDVDVSIPDAKDTLSGFKKSQYKVNDKPWTDYTGQFTISEEGETQIHARAFDQAGNISEVSSTTVRIDRTKPSKPALVLSANQYTRDNVGFTISGSTDLSAVHYEYRIGSGEFISGNNGMVTTSGESMITARAVDAAGNMSAESSAIAKIDKVAPDIHFSVEERDWSSSNVTVHLTYMDEHAGINSNTAYYKLTNSPHTPSDWNKADSNQVILKLEAEGEWYLHAKVEDVLGNEAERVTSFLRIQQKPKSPVLQVASIQQKQARLEWSLPEGGTFTEGYEYLLTNRTTGRTWTVPYPDNTVVDSSLQEGQTYEYELRARNHVGTSESSNKVTVLSLPASVTRVHIDPVLRTPSRALISYIPVSTAIGYHIRAINLTTMNMDFEATVTGSVYQELDDLTPGALYDISVAAVNPSGEGVSSHSSYLSLPDQPGGFTSVQSQEDRIRLTWGSVKSATYYELERDGMSVYKDVYVDYEDMNLLSGTDYHYQVSAENATGYGDHTVYHASTLPAQVNNFHMVTADVYSITAAWEATRGASGYAVSVNGGPELILPPEAREFRFDGLPAGAVAELRIRAVNRSGSGAEQKLQSVTLPNEPSGVEIESISANGAILSWKPSVGTVKYKVCIDGREYTISNSGITLTNLLPGKVYTASIQSGNAAGFGQSVEQQLLTLPSVVGGVRIKYQTATSVTLAWDKVQGSEYYHVIQREDHTVKHSQEQEITFGNLFPGVMYHFELTAENRSGKGASSSFVLRMLPDQIDENTVQLTHLTEHSVSIGWTLASGSDATNVYVDDQFIGETADAVFELSGLESGRFYLIRLEPVNSTGPGNSVVMTLHTKPSKDYDVYIQTDTNFINITWEQESANETFVISYKGKEIYRGQGRKYLWEGLDPDTTYNFLMWSENQLGVRSEPRSLRAHTDTRFSAAERSLSLYAKHTMLPVLPSSLPSEPKPDAVNYNTGFMDIEHIFSRDKIKELAETGILKGTSDTTFEPSRVVTRAEFASMIVRALRLPEASDAMLSFEDIHPDSWYITELRTAVFYRVAKGFSGKIFVPDGVINREQASKMVGNAFDFLPADEAASIYSDDQGISEWARTEVMGLTKKSLVQGYPDGSFRPKKNITRAEAAELIYNMLHTKR